MRTETKYFIWSDEFMDYIEVQKSVYDEFLFNMEQGEQRAD